MREARGELPGPLCACACSLFINKKNKSLREARGGPPGLLCVSACELNFFIVMGVSPVELYLVCCVFLLVPEV